MTVYVDDYRIKARVGRITANWSHMMADSREELIQFARKLGLKDSWVQDKKSGIHYDVTDTMRKKALEFGAVELPIRTPEWLRVHKQSVQQYRE